MLLFFNELGDIEGDLPYSLDLKPEVVLHFLQIVDEECDGAFDLSYSWYTLYFWLRYY